METKNALISSARIEIADHGMLTAIIWLDYGGSDQAFGCFSLYSPATGMGEKNYAGHFIYRVLETVGVRKWGELAGTAIRVVADMEHVEAIGHIVKDEWFNPRREFEELKQDSSVPHGEHTAASPQRSEK
jgi:hypothetical protein